MKTANVFNDSEGLYRKTVSRCLVHRPHYSARLIRFGSRGPSECEIFSQMRYRNAFTEIAWAVAEQGLGMAMSTLASEKNRALLQRIVVYRQRVLQTVTSLVFRGHDLLCSPENRKF